MVDPAREVETQAFQDMVRQDLTRRLDEMDTYPANALGRVSALEVAFVASLVTVTPLALWVWLS